MDSQSIIIAINLLTTISGGTFFIMWVRGVNRSLREKVTVKEFEEYKTTAKEMREIRENQIRIDKECIDKGIALLDDIMGACVREHHCSERMSILKEDHKERSTANSRDHSEFFERLRKVESIRGL